MTCCDAGSQSCVTAASKRERKVQLDNENTNTRHGAMGKKDRSSTEGDKDALHKTRKSTESTETMKAFGKAMHAIELPTTADGLTADKLTAEQKNIFKKECQYMYGHQYAKGKRKLPANSIESATLQLAARMKAKQVEKKNKSKSTEATK